MLDERLPLVLYSPSSLVHLGQCDCDCACVLDVSVTEPVQAGSTWVRQSGLLPFPLADGWQAAFNPGGPVGVVVLNPAAQGLLARFAKPASQTGPAPDAEGRALDSLVRAGLLRSPDTAAAAPTHGSTLSAWLHISEACNLHCPYCYVPKRPRLATAEMGRRAVERLVALASRHGYRSLQLKYAGGEPTLNFPAVWAVHEHAARLAAGVGLGLKEVLLTNGVSVGNAMLDVIAEAGMKLMVSLDGGPAAHAQTRGRPDGTPTFDLVVSSVDRAVARGLHVDISITLTALNLDGVPDAVAFALDRHLPFSLNFYRECHTGQKLGQAVLARLRPDPDRLIEVIRRALALVEAAPAYPLPLTGILDRARLDVPHCHPCSAGRDYVAIDPDGHVSACQMLLEEPWARLDDQDPLQAIRQRGLSVFRPVQENEDCRACQWQTACSGGCPLLRGTSLHQSYCRVYRTILPELVQLEGKRLISLYHAEYS